MNEFKIRNDHFKQLCELQTKIDEFGKIFQDYVLYSSELDEEFIIIIKKLMQVMSREGALIDLLAIINIELESLIADQTLKLS